MREVRNPHPLPTHTREIDRERAGVGKADRERGREGRGGV